MLHSLVTLNTVEDTDVRNTRAGTNRDTGTSVETSNKPIPKCNIIRNTRYNGRMAYESYWPLTRRKFHPRLPLHESLYAYHTRHTSQMVRIAEYFAKQLVIK